MSISFIVPAHNEAANIQACIQAIRLAAPEAEVVVVADACSDATAEIASREGAVLVEVEHRHIAATRNAGARAARGEILFFVDGDTRVTSAVVQAGRAALEAGAAGGGALFRFDRPIPAYARVVEKLAALFCLLTQMSGGCILFCSRSTFDRLGGFNTAIYAGEELDFAHRVKKIGRFRVVPQAVVTSGRKVRAYSGWELLRITWQVLWKGPRALYDRNGLELWYERREEPHYPGKEKSRL